MVLLEVQMQGKPGFKHRLTAQSFRFLQLHPQVEHLEVVVVVPHRRLRLGPDRLTRPLEGEARGHSPTQPPLWPLDLQHLKNSEGAKRGDEPGLRLLQYCFGY